MIQQTVLLEILAHIFAKPKIRGILLSYHKHCKMSLHFVKTTSYIDIAAQTFEFVSSKMHTKFTYSFIKAQKKYNSI